MIGEVKTLKLFGEGGIFSFYAFLDLHDDFKCHVLDAQDRGKSRNKKGDELVG